LSQNTLKIYKNFNIINLKLWAEAWTVTQEERNALTALEKNTIRKIYHPIKEEQKWSNK
jgi:hypothetical protein